MLRRARAEPETLVIGIDAEAAAMRAAARRAAAAPARGGVANALFLVEAAERLPGTLDGRADLVTVALPWGSLLRALLGPDADVLARMAALLRADGELVLLLTDELVDPCRYSEAGLQPVQCRAATAADVERLSSAWGKRLGATRRRSAKVWRFRAG